MNDPILADVARQLKETVTIRRVLQDKGVALHVKPGGRAFALCPLHREDTPSFRVFSAEDRTERFAIPDLVQYCRLTEAWAPSARKRGPLRPVARSNTPAH